MIELSHIEKSFGEKKVLRDVSLTVPDGGFVSLLGSSGCGKSTLLRIICGLEIPDSGRIMFDGRCVFDAERGINVPVRKRGVSLVFQDFVLWPHLDVFENVAFPLRARRDTKALRERVEAALALVHLEDFSRRSVGSLSGGQQQRVGFARAIVSNPRFLLFDEPLSALDAVLREQMRAEISAITERLDCSSIFVTHDQIEAMAMSDEIALMDQGRIVRCCTPEELYANPENPFAASFIGKADFLSSSLLLRPEKVSLEPMPDGRCVQGTLRSYEYTGPNYALVFDVGGRDWTVFSDRRISPDTVMPLYYRDEDVVRISI